MQITSTAFSEGKSIPVRYTCDGANVSPPLAWQGVPAGASSLALVADDPDAPRGTWVHWVYFNLPADLGGLPEGVEPAGRPAPGGTQGKNDFRELGYGGPCPPGGTHRYFFKLYALDIVLDLPPGAGKADLVKAMKNHVLAETTLMGTYKRK